MADGTLKDTLVNVIPEQWLGHNRELVLELADVIIQGLGRAGYMVTSVVIDFDDPEFFERLSGLIKDAYYHARDNGGTMHTAADDAARAVLAALKDRGR